MVVFRQVAKTRRGSGRLYDIGVVGSAAARK